MKAGSRRVSSFFIAIILALALVGVPSAGAQGDAFQVTDSYVLAFGSTSGASEYAYFSPFTPLLTYDNTEVYGYSILFGLKNTYTDEISEIAYCTDMPVDAVNADYRRLNLTDSTYAAARADKLRAVVLNSYPHTSLETLRAASGIADLSVCEAITGTQLAVWKTAHGDIVQIKDFLYTASAGYNSGHSEPTATERSSYINGTAEYQSGVKSRIQKLYEYLMDLPGQSAVSTILSDAAFVDRSEDPTVSGNDNGTYDVTVSATIDLPSGCDVTLTAYMNDGAYYEQMPLSSSGSYTLTIEDVPAADAFETVTLSIDGIQDVQEDVFLLDADGIRGVSQSMIAPLSGEMPVHAEVKAEPDRVLEIHKTGGGSPLANISFEIYYVGTPEEYASGALGIGAKPTQADIEKYAKTSLLVGTITTDASGYGALNLRTEDGVYLVRELPNALSEDSVAFFVSLPDYYRRDADGNPSYTITAYPKNTIRDEQVKIEKDVTDLDNEHDTFAVGENHTWIIQSTLPSGMATARKYEISDTLDKRLTLISVDRVALGSDRGRSGDSDAPGYVPDENETPLNAESLVLTEDRDYTLTTFKTEDGCDSFSVVLTSSGIAAVAAAADGSSELRVYVTAQINTGASMGESIPNTAHVEYTNAQNTTYEADSDTPEVHTGGIQLFKQSPAGAALSGASFRVYRMARQDEISDPDCVLIKLGETQFKMLPVSFYDTADLTDGPVTELTTGQDGTGYIYGLAYGDYYLVETKAPEGYNALREPVKFTVSADSHLNENRLVVTNTSGAELPETGGIGTGLFTGAGLLLMCSAAALLLARKYRYH